MLAIHQKPSGNLFREMRNFPECSQTMCSRCHGLLVKTFCISPKEGIAEFQISAIKCLQCGDLFDSTILENRWRSQQHELTHKNGGS